MPFLGLNLTILIFAALMFVSELMGPRPYPDRLYPYEKKERL